MSHSCVNSNFVIFSSVLVRLLSVQLMNAMPMNATNNNVFFISFLSLNRDLFPVLNYDSLVSGLSESAIKRICLRLAVVSFYMADACSVVQ